ITSDRRFDEVERSSCANPGARPGTLFQWPNQSKRTGPSAAADTPDSRGSPRLPSTGSVITLAGTGEKDRNTSASSGVLATSRSARLAICQSNRPLKGLPVRSSLKSAISLTPADRNWLSASRSVGATFGKLAYSDSDFPKVAPTLLEALSQLL